MEDREATASTLKKLGDITAPEWAAAHHEAQALLDDLQSATERLSALLASDGVDPQ